MHDVAVPLHLHQLLNLHAAVLRHLHHSMRSRGASQANATSQVERRRAARGFRAAAAAGAAASSGGSSKASSKQQRQRRPHRRLQQRPLQRRRQRLAAPTAAGPGQAKRTLPTSFRPRSTSMTCSAHSFSSASSSCSSAASFEHTPPHQNVLETGRGGQGAQHEIVQGAVAGRTGTTASRLGRGRCMQ